LNARVRPDRSIVLELEARLRQQAAIAELSRLALDGADLATLMDRTAAAVAETLDLEYCKVLELLPGDQGLLLRAGVGWKEGRVGQVTVEAGRDSQAGYTLWTKGPVIVEDLRTETRFQGPALLSEHGVTSGISVVIDRPGRPFGVLGAHAKRRRRFTTHDVNFLQAAANIVASAVERRKAETALTALQERLAGFLAIAPDAMVAVDRTLKIVLYNHSAEEMLGWTAEEALGRPPGLFVPKDQFDLVMEAIDLRPQATFEPGHLLCQQFEITVVRKNGQVFPVELSLSRLGGMDADFFVMAIARDITDRKKSEEALRNSETRFRSVFEHTAVGKALIHPADDRLLQVNAALCRMLGFTEAELLGRAVRDVLHPEDLRTPGPLLQDLREGRSDCVQFECRCLGQGGRPIWAHVTLSLVRDGRGDPLYYIAEAQDFTERKRFEAQLVYFANHDPLTGLHNRRRFREELERELAMAKRYRSAGAVMLLDMDQFKDINDSLGHRAGDEVLTAVAGSLRERLRSTDVVARLGGDEFGILVPHADAEQAKELAHQTLQVVSKHAVTIGGQPSRVTASIGIALFPSDGQAVDDLLARADIALYHAKRTGPSRFSLYEPASDREALISSRRTWEHRIRKALEGDEFVLYVQPILDLRKNEISRYELLLRMDDPSGQLILPDSFLGVAERLGLIREIDRWVVQKGIRLLAEQSRKNPGFCLEVNLSSQAFDDPTLLDLVQTELTRGRVDPGRLVLEITETAAIANIHEARRFIETLSRFGCHFALDDFGIGYSSFSHLKHLPVDCLKIDGGFIADLPNSPVDRHLVSAIAELARGLGKTTIAEFVGDAETVRLLREYGVDYAQGFHIARPHPISQL
jgi:diguanylate cyclase (GGDEF)-like protein/PAS domain S-box-containing protein